MSLRELQGLFQEAVFESDTNGPALARVSEYIHAKEGLSSAELLRIYGSSIFGTLTRALSEIYPVCRRLVGPAFFETMARIFIHQMPSHSADLADYGQALADFVAEFEPAAGLTYLPDVARLEWHWHRAFHAADEPGLDVTVLGEIAKSDRSRILFRLPASATLLASNFPIHRIWEVNQDNWKGEQQVSLAEGGARLMVWRQDYDMRIDPLDERAWQLLIAIERQSPFAVLSDPETMPDIATLLPRCIQCGWIAGFQLADQTL
ncbi:MAG: putative DNA-binding domain-containing protein [Proteobacteria bacterium]|nr:putative DNA-binding domain-containing protein [Pseudomonadota bacterium]